MPYFQSQQGGLCRKHAINNFLGNECLTTNQFYKLCDEYDNIYSKDIGISCKNYDYFTNGINVNGYFMEKMNYPTLTLDNKDLLSLKPIFEKLLPFIKGFFIFNTCHIWTIKKEDNIWFELDSLYKPKIIKNNIYQNLISRKRCFYTIIFSSKDVEIKKILENNKALEEIIELFLERNFKEIK